jgi:hypothetical protein
MKIFTNQRGALDLVLAVLVVGLIAIAGTSFYYQHQTQLAAQKAADANAQSKQIVSTPASDAFKIPELGIQITLPDGLTKTDVYYVADTKSVTLSDSNDKILHSLGSVQITTHSLVAKEPGCIQIITIDKYDEDISTYMFASPPTDIRKIGTSYYGLADHQSTCSRGSLVLENTQYALLKQAYKSIEAAK